MKKVIVFVCAGTWQIQGIKNAKDLGYQVIALDGDKNASGFEFADKFFIVDIGNPQAVLNCLKENNIKPDGAISYCSEVGMVSAAKIREVYNLKGPNVELSEKLTNKLIQRKIWTDSGVEKLKWLLLSEENLGSLEEFTKSTGFPVIVKPVDSSGSRGVTKVENKSELEMAIKHAFEFSKSKRILVEEYLDGVEYTVETFNNNGETYVLAVTEKFKVEGSRGTVSKELAYPSIEEQKIENIRNKVINATKALSYNDGPGHTEVILTKSGYVGLVEMAGRGGGFGVFDRMIPMASGVDVSKLTIQQLVGDKVQVDKNQIQKNIFSLKFFPSLCPGIVKSIQGFEEAAKIDGCQVGSYVKVGDKVESDFRDGNRLGYMLVKGKDLSEVQNKILKIESLVKFSVG